MEAKRRVIIDLTQWTICGYEDVFMTSSLFQAQDQTKTSLEPNMRSKMKTTNTSIGRPKDHNQNVLRTSPGRGENISGDGTKTSPGLDKDVSRTWQKRLQIEPFMVLKSSSRRLHGVCNPKPTPWLLLIDLSSAQGLNYHRNWGDQVNGPHPPGGGGLTPQEIDSNSFFRTNSNENATLGAHIQTFLTKIFYQCNKCFINKSPWNRGHFLKFIHSKSYFLLCNTIWKHLDIFYKISVPWNQKLLHNVELNMTFHTGQLSSS